jgi:hypothetical protein
MGQQEGSSSNYETHDRLEILLLKQRRHRLLPKLGLPPCTQPPHRPVGRVSSHSQQLSYEHQLYK